MFEFERFDKVVIKDIQDDKHPVSKIWGGREGEILFCDHKQKMAHVSIVDGPVLHLHYEDMERV